MIGEVASPRSRRSESSGPPRATQRRRASTPVNGTEAAARVADVLVAVCEHGGSVGVTELSQKLGLGKSVVHRILQTLEDRMLIRAAPGQPGKYTLGPVVRGWGSLPTLRRDLTAAATPALRAAFERCGQTVTLSLLTGFQRCYVGQVSLEGSTVHVDRAFPLYAGASGKAMLAFVPQEVRQQVLSGQLRPLTERTMTDSRRLTDHLINVRKTQIAVSIAEVRVGIGSVASPIFSAGQVIGAISVCLSAARLDIGRVRELAEVVRPAASGVSEAMGWSALKRAQASPAARGRELGWGRPS